jgi:hypothetical protein
MLALRNKWLISSRISIGLIWAHYGVDRLRKWGLCVSDEQSEHTARFALGQPIVILPRKA